MNKVEEILECTNRGLLVFAYFLNEQFKGPGRRFLNPLYLDKNPSCYVYLDEKRNRYYIKDFGQADFHGDCFFFVGKLFKTFKFSQLIKNQLLGTLEMGFIKYTGQIQKLGFYIRIHLESILLDFYNCLTQGI